MRLRLKVRPVPIGMGFSFDSERRSSHARTVEAEVRDRRDYQRCGGGRRVLRKRIEGGA